MTKYMKEVWIQFADNETYSENEEKLLELLDKAPGKCKVKVFLKSTNKIKTLVGYDFDETQLSLLTDAYGEENVKFQKVKAERNKSYIKPIIRQIIPCNHDMYAVVKDSVGDQYKYKVLMYALCNDGEVYPLFFDRLYGVCLLDDAIFSVDGYELDDNKIYQEGGKQNEQE